MSFAEHMMGLREEINGLHATRAELMYRLNRFHADLRASIGQSMAEMRKTFKRERAQASAARHSFVSRNRQTVAGMLAALGAERSAAHRNFRGEHA